MAAMANVRRLDFAGVIEEIGLSQARDGGLDMVARAPYSQLVYQRLGIEIARVIRQTYLPPKKVIALDCDNTLWGGVIGEDHLSGIALGDDYPGRSFRLFQSALLALRQRGILLVLTSKNEAADVWQVCDHHPAMLIQRGDIAAHRIDWQAKSANLRSLASELNLGLDSFVFIDDSPTERLEVLTNAPAVTVLPLPKDPAQYVEVLLQLWCFDAANITAEDQQRTQYMRQEQQRQQLQAGDVSLGDYLAALQLKVNIRPVVMLSELRPEASSDLGGITTTAEGMTASVTGAELARIAQLTQKPISSISL